VSAFIAEHRERFGVEPICRTLEVSASAYYERAKCRRSKRSIEDEQLLLRIREIHERGYCAYGYRAGVQGAKRRGKAWRTTKTDPAAQRLCCDATREEQHREQAAEKELGHEHENQERSRYRRKASRRLGGRCAAPGQLNHVCKRSGRIFDWV